MCLPTLQRTSTVTIPECILFTEFSFVKIRGRKCIQFTDDRDGTKYALKVINGTTVTFQVSYINSKTTISSRP